MLEHNYKTDYTSNKIVMTFNIQNQAVQLEYLSEQMRQVLDSQARIEQAMHIDKQPKHKDITTP